MFLKATTDFLKNIVMRGERLLGLVKDIISKHRLFINYMLWGSLSTVVSWISFGLFSIFFDNFIKNPITSATVSNILSWFCVVIFAFIINKLWVFKSKSFNKKVLFPEFIKFFFSSK